MTTEEYTLTQGPSREQLFDSLRLGLKAKELRVLGFWGTKQTEHGKSGSSLPIEIEGIHKASNDERDWFFWGKLTQITSGDTWVPMWEAEDVCFVFGRWDTFHRCGNIKLSKTSFFTS